MNGAPAIELIPQDRPAHRRRNAIFSILLSLAVITAVVLEMGGVNIPRLAAMVPANPAFWMVFAGYYLITPASEWYIFRRLWQIPPAGFLALLRKKVYNELLLGYLGEAYFYTWARRRVSLEAAPFGAVKDVAILSAMTGNAVTMALLIVAFPMLGATQLGLDTRMLTLSLGVILAISLFAMVFRRRVFSLARGELGMITQVHLARIVLSTVFLAVLWHLALPQVPLTWWLYLSTLRLLVSRLPLMPNKDLLFAGIAVVVLGHERDIGALMTLMAGLILATHLVLGAAIAINDLVNPEKRG
ncbi:hypothetical protein [Novosphingobium beihaiensis]|uniref:Flippase-like domain-containing protein n=1 Tax=Novosphingobium beihaiensis TaxID=2930389 RepID=A0ABT0BMT5_9SPHN|nr:hypothetical protein [Novosphingobium beihaiensis]MCJ2186293.1 hypothetical protein [Novosphingobium beihaiensis]